MKLIRLPLYYPLNVFVINYMVVLTFNMVVISLQFLYKVFDKMTHYPRFSYYYVYLF